MHVGTRLGFAAKMLAASLVSQVILWFVSKPGDAAGFLTVCAAVDVVMVLVALMVYPRPKDPDTR